MESNKRGVPTPEEVWLQIAIVVSRAESSRKPESSVYWANFITDAFVKRFGKKDE